MHTWPKQIWIITDVTHSYSHESKFSSNEMIIRKSCWFHFHEDLGKLDHA